MRNEEQQKRTPTLWPEPPALAHITKETTSNLWSNRGWGSVWNEVKLSEEESKGVFHNFFTICLCFPIHKTVIKGFLIRLFFPGQLLRSDLPHLHSNHETSHSCSSYFAPLYSEDGMSEWVSDGERASLLLWVKPWSKYTNKMCTTANKISKPREWLVEKGTAVPRSDRLKLCSVLKFRIWIPGP